MIDRLSATGPVPAPAPPARPVQAPRQTAPVLAADRQAPAQARHGAVPAIGGAAAQLRDLATTYGVAIPAGVRPADCQSTIVRAVVRAEAKRKGIPETVALGISGLESEWTMWRNVEAGTVLSNANRRGGKVVSTDWGVMQINDKAHRQAFPKVTGDLVANVRFGLQFLVDQRQENKGSLGLGMGDWDATLASYNLGHRPKGNVEMKIARAYVHAVRSQGLKGQSLPATAVGGQLAQAPHR